MTSPAYSLVDLPQSGRTQTIAYHASGEGDDTVFLFHGVTANHRVWAPIQQMLESEVRVVSVDQRGHGHSGKPQSGYLAEDFSNDIAGLIEILGGPEANIVVGHSLGSRNAIAAAARFPDLVSGIVAIDFTPFIEEEVFDSLASRVAAGNQSFASLDEVKTYLQGRYRLLPPDAVTRRAEYGFHQVGGSWMALADPEAMRQTVDGLREDLSGYLSEVSVPAIVVRGGQSVLVTEKAFEATRHLRPDLDYRTVDGADHYVPEEKPQEVARIVRDLLTLIRKTTT